MKKFLTLVLVMAAASGAWAERKPLQVIEDAPFRYPESLLREGLFNGKVEMALAVDAQGVLTDSLVIGATTPEFAEAAKAYMSHIHFKAAEVDGVPNPVVTRLTFNFAATGVVVQGTFFEVTNAFLNRMHEGMTYRAFGMKDLDRIPTPKTVIAPTGGKDGMVDVRFFIDEEGNVRFPYIETSSDQFLAVAALTAVKQWKFEPPTHQGRPVLTFASQVFNFVVKEEPKEKAPEKVQ